MEDAHVVEEVFVVEEEFGEVAEVLAVDWVSLAVDLED